MGERPITAHELIGAKDPRQTFRRAHATKA